MLDDLAAAAVLVPVLTLASIAAARRVGRWVGAALRRTFADAVTGVVEVPLRDLQTSVDGIVANRPRFEKLERSIARLAEVGNVRHDNHEHRLIALEEALEDHHPQTEEPNEHPNDRH